MSKGQAFMEWLFTYGWAIIILILLISVLWYFGILKTPRIMEKEEIRLDNFLTNYGVIKCGFCRINNCGIYLSDCIDGRTYYCLTNVKTVSNSICR